MDDCTNSPRHVLSPTRRAFLMQAIGMSLGTSAAAAQKPAPRRQPAASSSGIRKPRRLRPGSVVGIVDPASAMWDPADVDIVVESLAALGLKAKLGAHLMDRRGYLAGRDEDRAADVMAMFTDPDVAAVQALRGGWGCARLLPHLDFDAIARTPKILLGHSDITSLLLSVHARGGFVTFHGMNGASEWNRFNVDLFRRVLMRGEMVTMTNPLDTAPRSITSKSGALRWGEQVRRDIEAGKPPPQSRKSRDPIATEKQHVTTQPQSEAARPLTLRDAVEIYLADASGRGNASSTLATKRRMLESVLALVGDCTLATFGEVEASKVRAEQRAAGLLASTINARIRLLESLLRRCHVLGLRPHPARGWHACSAKRVCPRKVRTSSDTLARPRPWQAAPMWSPCRSCSVTGA